MYETFLNSPTAEKWQRIGLRRRAGVATGLFSLYSKDSIGIGEIPDLKLFIDWAKSCGFTIVQLLPINDVGFRFSPYDAESSFALDPMYLSLEKLTGVDLALFASDFAALRERFSLETERVNYAVKRAKLELLWKIFENRKNYTDREFKHFQEQNRFWLGPYAEFKLLKERNEERAWEFWRKNQIDPRDRERVLFFEWMQWQLYQQWARVAEHASKAGVLLMGDIPFLCSRDSADVWANPTFFKLDLFSGAPPDLYFSKGQRWGMPPYNWEQVEQTGYEYLVQKLKVAENLYDLYRIDHFVGLFRLWTISGGEAPENFGANGVFDPVDETRWEEHGRKIINAMLPAARMLPCAEDLGVVPDCSYKVLAEYAIPGMEIQRWAKHWGTDWDFKKPEEYRENSIATLSTHDMAPLSTWWEHEAGTVDAEDVRKQFERNGLSFEEWKDKLFEPSVHDVNRLRWKKLAAPPEPLSATHRASVDERERYWDYIRMRGKPHEKASVLFMKHAFAAVNDSASVFSVQLLQDVLALSECLASKGADFRINVPGTHHDSNWSIRMPLSLEDYASLNIASDLRAIHRQSGRL